jgi:hypothetical protein
MALSTLGDRPVSATVALSWIAVAFAIGVLSWLGWLVWRDIKVEHAVNRNNTPSAMAIMLVAVLYRERISILVDMRNPPDGYIQGVVSR